MRYLSHLMSQYVQPLRIKTFPPILYQIPMVDERIFATKVSAIRGAFNRPAVERLGVEDDTAAAYG